jgi:hypothetical protein
MNHSNNAVIKIQSKYEVAFNAGKITTSEFQSIASVIREMTARIDGMTQLQARLQLNSIVAEYNSKLEAQFGF